MKTPSEPTRGVHELHRETVVDRPIDEVFAFFSDAGNLERLTPGFLRFEVRSARPIDMRDGAEIDYALRLRGLPLRWRSRITVWDPPHRFVDEQVRGPYRYWRHEHRFEPVGSGTRCFDTVRYAHRGGRLIERLLVRPDIERIFDFRQRALREIFAA